ncbi:hypothetical protein IQ07DRAFT_86329 [Pyrenochaeta sp. DS3sAY3a]|nr:hypothetical protein IQ07DRAFT_86329 [Pyrenochaeta sp. DS3sAY3a]
MMRRALPSAALAPVYYGMCLIPRTWSDIRKVTPTGRPYPNAHVVRKAAHHCPFAPFFPTYLHPYYILHTFFATRSRAQCAGGFVLEGLSLPQRVSLLLARVVQARWIAAVPVMCAALPAWLSDR